MSDRLRYDPKQITSEMLGAAHSRAMLSILEIMATTTTPIALVQLAEAYAYLQAPASSHGGRSAHH
jgi:hypothetical protein